jgi:hypothetical protein
MAKLCGAAEHLTHGKIIIGYFREFRSMDALLSWLDGAMQLCSIIHDLCDYHGLSLSRVFRDSGPISVPVFEYAISLLYNVLHFL